MDIGTKFEPGQDGAPAATDRRRWQLPNGRYVYLMADGETYSHQPPNDNWDCKHASLAEAVGCYAAQCAAVALGQPARPMASPAAALGRLGGWIGGRAKTSAKQAAARANGAKGGRPRRTPPAAQ